MKHLALWTALALTTAATSTFAQSMSVANVSYIYAAPDTQRLVSNTTGATTESALTADTTYNGIDSAYSRASLAEGSLKASAGGTADYINSSATAQFGDTFGAVDAATGQAHAWQPGEKVTFSFSVTGTIRQSLPSALMAPLDPDFQSLVIFGFQAYRPGYMALQTQMDALWDKPWNAEAQAEYTRLSAAISALRISDSGVGGYLGRPYTPWFDGATAPYIDVQANTPTVISSTFEPGGSFEWVAYLNVSARFQSDFPLPERLTFVVDFSHSVGASFSGPEGTVTTSASGFFPNTVSAVPEPATTLLWLAGFAMLGLIARRGRAPRG
ncbi:PEP-CTERM sorting domain-containing protein [Roseateles sp. LKC17W]|uniref:PEP-CTERM sorting domain-containing protein n=1 Tax=Pelomonas margarita TaxID=3299031 RepID=A0ABW7FHW8_9BURK